MAKAPSKRFGILLTTSLFIILAMGLYYTYTQNVKEAKVKRRAFKVLYRHASDLAEKEKDIRAQYREPLMIEISVINKAIEEKTIRKIVLQNKLKDLMHDISFVTGINKLSEHHRTLNSLRIAYQQQQNEINELLKRKEGLRSAFRTRFDSKDNKDDWYLLKDMPYVVDHEERSDSIFIHKEQLFGDVFGNELFESFIVYNHKTMVYKTMESISDLQLLQMAKKDDGGDAPDKDINSNLLFSKMTHKDGYEVVNPSENQVRINIGGQDYQAFIIPVQSVGMSHLVGLVSHNKYLSMKRGFDRGLISAVSVFIVLLLLGIPVVKLMTVTPGEAFSIKSLITLLISVAGLFFMVLFFSLYVSNKLYIKSHITGKNQHLEKLSQSIQTAFNNEIDSMLLQLDVFAEVISDPNLLKDSLVPDGANLLTAGEAFNTWDIKLQRKIKEEVMAKIDSGTYPNWLEAFTASVKDKETVFVLENAKEWKQSPTGIDISKRDYIQNTHRFNKHGEYFGFESIFSLNTAKPQVVISQKQENSDYAVCITAEMHSINNVVLPYGYSFCIIDKTGKEWFHENPRNNLRENLFDETDNFPLLKAAVQSRHINSVSCDYKMKSNLMRISPLDADMGLFLVTMHEVNDSYQIFHQSVYMILGSVLLLFAFWLLIAIVFRWYEKMWSTSRYHAHSLLCFFPDRELMDKYIRLFYVNTVFLLLFVVVTLLFYDAVYVNHWVRLVGISGAGLLFLNVKEVKSQKSTLSLWHLTITFLSQIVLLFLIEYLLGGSFASGSIFISIAILMGINIILFVVLKVKMTNKIPKKWCFNVYFAYIFSIAMAAIFVPLFTVYTVVYNQEITMHYMHHQRYVADKLIERQNRFSRDSKPLVVDELNKRGQYFNIMHNMRQVVVDKENTVPKGMLSTDHYVRLFGNVRTALYFINNTIEDRGNLVKPNYVSSADSLYAYSRINNRLKLHVKSGGYPYFDQDTVLTMNAVQVLDLIERFRGFGIGLLLVIVLYSAFFPKMASYLFPHYKYPRDILGNGKNIALPKRGAKRYMVTMPDAELFDEVLKTDRAIMFALGDQQQQQAFLDIDVTDLDVYLFWQRNMFESTNQFKTFLLRLEKILSNKLQRSITVVCFDQPMVCAAQLQLGLSRISGDTLELNNMVERLRDIFFSFSLYYLPLPHQLPSGSNKKPFQGRLAWLNKEIGSNAFLLSRYESLKDNEDAFTMNEKDGLVDDGKVYGIHFMFSSYYQKIWDNCSMQEKSVLFDISEDHLIIMHKEGVVLELINKGLVHKGRYLSLFNLSFTHFVALQQMELIRINTILRESNISGWSQYNLPIKLLAAAILIFLFVTQQEFLSSLQSIIISVGAIITFGVRFFNNPFKSDSNAA